MFKRVFSPRNSLTLFQALLLGLMVGLAFLPFRMTTAYFAGHFPMDADPALTTKGHDRTQGLTGAFYYAQDKWRVPLFQTQNLGAPEGTNVVYTDCVPGAALLLKLAYQVHPKLFDYFGVWLALCLVLNPVVFCWILHELEVRDWRYLLAGALFASCVPELLFKHAHAAISGDFLILTALALYFRTRRTGGFTGKMAAGFAVLILATLLDNVYLLAMVWAIYLATVVQNCADHRLGWGRGAVYFGGTLAGCLAAMIFFGHLTWSGGLPPSGEGFGVYSMNLLSPFWPWRSLFSYQGKNIDATHGQFEGYNYLGAGMLVLLAVNAWKSWRAVPGLLRRNWALAGVLSLLALGAFSNEVYLGKWRLLSYHISPYDHFMENFRASGRLFWPAGYVLMAALVVLTCRRLAPRTAAVLLLATAALQAADMSVSTRLGTVPLPAYAEPQQVADWENLFRPYSRVEILPPFEADTNPSFNIFLQYVAARVNVPINTVYSARPPPNRDPRFVRADHPRLEPGVIYVFQKSDYTPERLAMVTAGQSFQMYEEADSYIVAVNFPPEVLTRVGGWLQPVPPAKFLPLALGTTLSFKDRADVPGVGYTGFYRPTDTGRPVRGDVVELRTGLDPALRGHRFTLTGQFRPHLDTAHPRLDMDVQLNGQAMGTWVFQQSDSRGVAQRSVTIPASATNAEILNWRFILHPPPPPATVDQLPYVAVDFVGLHVAP
ncbi:MAG TPA: DUF6311 domain-containing protein [Opitutales bacterium]|nr:DUF6311 domain-containing protein [Opitutales bacterium]